MEYLSTVLIVDDESIGRETLEALLFGQGYQLVFANNGQEALSQAAALKPDVILLDVMMPATATSLDIPPGFLRPDTEYEWEALAIEESGNQTLSSSFFSTMP